MIGTELKVVQFPKTAKQGGYYKRHDGGGHAASPIRDARTLRALRAALADSGKYAQRNLAIFDLGVASGRRCGDILMMQVRDVWDDIGGMKSKIEYWDQKTKKRWTFFLNEQAKRNLEKYMTEIGYISAGKRLVALNTWLFPSRKKHQKNTPVVYVKANGTASNKNAMPAGVLSVATYGEILKKAAKDHHVVGIDHLGTHSMRKTFAYHGFQQGGAEFVMLALGHSSMNVTRHYLTLDEEYTKEKYDQMVIPGLNDEE